MKIKSLRDLKGEGFKFWPETRLGKKIYENTDSLIRQRKIREARLVRR